MPAGPSPSELIDLMSALQGRLATLPVIEQAKGALMMTYGLTADAAFAVLRSHSQNRNIKIRDLAAELISNAPHSPFGARAQGELNRMLEAVTERFRRPASPPSAEATGLLAPFAAPPSGRPRTNDAGLGRQGRPGPAS